MDPGLATSLLLRISEHSDESAFNELYSHYAPRIKNYLMREGAEAATAEDVAQQAMASVWHKAQMFDPEKGAATAWIFRIARNLRIDRVRKERVWQPLPEDHNEQISTEPLADDTLLAAERQKRVQEALRTLPPEQLQVVELCYLAGMTQSEVSDHLSVPIGTIKSRMRLAYSKLAPLLAGIK